MRWASASFAAPPCRSGLERERVGRFLILCIQLQCPSPVADRSLEVSAPTLCESLEPLNRRALRRQRRCVGEVLRALIEVLLPQQE